MTDTTAPPRTADETPRRTVSPHKVAFASFIGTSIEWYDFFLYGTASALVFGDLFFPTGDPLISTLLAFATFGVGFAARPIGGAVFGSLGDKLGRKKVLVVTLLVMGAATAAIGLLPTYGQIGVAAPILLVLLRLVQGFGVGGEWGAAALMAVEHAPKGRRGFFGSMPQMGVPAGTILSTGAFVLINRMDEQTFLSWGWRIPFLASFLLVIVGLLIRVSVEESPEFEKLVKEKKQVAMPLRSAVRDHWRVILLAGGMRFSENSVFYVVTVFLLSYGTTALGLERAALLNAALIAAFVEILTIPYFGAVSARFGARRMYLSAAALSVLLAFPFFLTVNTGNMVAVTIAMIVTIVVACVMYALQPSMMGSLFPAEVRSSAVSIGYQIAAVFAGGLSPFIATGLYAWSGEQWWPIAAYMMVMGLITWICTHLATKRYGGHLT
ncbi:MFS transporter [Streptomyces sp. CB01580]|uniref:MFS transporter n=1 Tax=Streptomyces sp. CB01580 TaxID=1703933 RepID=UPI0009A0EEBB|nr:MFS transporter [Streptomyces sp. CB01580]